MFVITLEGLPLSCTSVTGTSTVNVNVFSLARSDAQMVAVDVKLTQPSSYLWSTWPINIQTFNLHIIDPCITTVISPVVINPLVAF